MSFAQFPACMASARSHLRALGLAVLVILVAVPAAKADYVHLDFSGVAWPTFSGKVASDFEDDIMAIVAGDYAEFPWISVAKVASGAPATDTVVEFAEFGGVGALGNAHLVDWDNKLTAQNNIIHTNNSVGSAIDVYVPGFTGIGSPFTDTFARFTTAIGGTASHELGHGLGLRHFDTFGPAPIAGNPTPEPDHHIMATGSTGLAGTDRTDYDRAFSQHTRDKLHYLDPLDQPARTRAELLPAPGAHSSFLTAEDLTIGPLDTIAATGRQTMVKVASIAGPGEADYYKFVGAAGDKFYANIFSTRLSNAAGTGAGAGLDLKMALHRPDFSTLKVNDDTGYNATSGASPGIGDTVGDASGECLGKADFLAQLANAGQTELTYGAGEGTAGDSPYSTRSTDPILIDSPSGNYITLDASGIWFVEVFPFSETGTGDYELFVTLETTIPEPANALLLVFGSLGLVFFGRRRVR